MASRPGRTQRGEYFSRGACETWDALVSRGETQSQFADAFKLDRSLFHKALYGDTKAGRDVLTVCSRELAIPAEYWTEDPIHRWTFPHARRVRAA